MKKEADPVTVGGALYLVGSCLAFGMALVKYSATIEQWWEIILASLLSLMMALMSWIAVGVYLMGILTEILEKLG